MTMIYEIVISGVGDEALDAMLRLTIIHHPDVQIVKVDGLSDDELKARRRALFPTVKWPRKPRQTLNNIGRRR
jgi:ethanolamine ammonia-lyase small subunit